MNYDISTGLNQEKYSGTLPDPFDETLKTNIAQRQTYRFIQRYIGVRGSLLDVGCGNGKLLHLAQSDGFKVKGLEISPALAAAVKNTLNIDVVAEDFLDYDHPVEEEYQVIILRHVLEHLPEPVSALKKINSLLTNDGYAVFEFPNIEAWDLRFKRFTSKIGWHRKRYPQSYIPGHCNEYCRASFRRLISITGFRILLWQTYSYNPLTDYFFNRIKIGDKARTIIMKVREVG